MSENQLFDVAIIGSGPAALTAALYCARGSAHTLVLGGSKWGGQLMLTTLVENFPGFPDGIQGPELMEKMKQAAQKHGAEIVLQDVTRIDFSQPPFSLSTSQANYHARSVIIATGASTLWLDAPGIQKLIGRGISSCAPCDAPFFREKRVAVVGGGDSAMEEALTIAKYAKEVVIIHRRDNFRASMIMQKRVLSHPKIKVAWNTEVLEAMGDTSLKELRLKNNQSQEIKAEAFDGLFIAIGHKPETDLFKGILTLDERGYIKKPQGDRAATNIPGVFVAGDVFDSQYRQAVTAAGYGCMAALETLKYLVDKSP